eukprot:gene30744-35780_t
MAVPYVAGVAAIYLGLNPSATPAEVRKALIQTASNGEIKDDRMRPGTPNKLLYTRGVLKYK